jgi:2Fe-2S ferredoxin
VPRIIYVQPDGQRREIEAPVGSSVMQGARRNHVAGIEAECGGAMACATCHVYVDPAWRDLVGGPSSDEAAMLDYAVLVDPERSRLACQINITERLDGLIVVVPPFQN